jgi:hypothetical protein
MGESVGLAHVRLAAALTLVACVAGAHEIGTTQVRMVTGAYTWAATVRSARPVDVRAIEVRFDGVLSVARRRDGAGPAGGTPARLTGEIPANAKTVTWRYGVARSTYSLNLNGTTVWVEGSEPSPPLPLHPEPPLTRGEVIVQYLRLGFLHIVPQGIDHILFVLGIFLLTTKLRAILAQVTAFTIAHSITLGLTMYGVVSLPSRVVEPLIALSIAYVAIENVVTFELKPWRPLVVFAFGLLHGMGFAGVLRTLHLPRGEFIPALVSFNIGIELAQLFVIGVAFLLSAAWFRHEAWYRPRFVVPASLIIAATGLFWTVQRLFSSS